MVKLNATLTKDQQELVKTGAITLEVSTTGFYISKSGVRTGRGRSPRQAIEAMK